ncbi:nad-dependent epimerase dehydratase [Plasmopara halstedii]|uniref:Nad-dependent epimerase dehydratase n=1 Tax=Plasmopara halstedii TaxID=4781 RepID=A0A0P1AS47_PLAHL|nr:nad-dependent epimerase dehydratase [Plasmopara halstedii]CEG44584.1 nad-dependent epimerase dehydratase [Plasmopara halstedii]|eukprot:XP_024580953.1 nad-dependent epimerase dehydratase [Plasmopara halstedii]
MLFGAQYDDDGGTDHSESSTTPPQSLRKKKPVGSTLKVATGPNSPIRSFGSTKSSFDSTASYLLANPHNSTRNYNYTGFVDSRMTGTTNGITAVNTPTLLPKTRRRNMKKKIDRFPKLKRPIDRRCMYPNVWKQLQFRKKIVQLATNVSEKPICVTGVDGFLASWIVCELLTRGYRVRGTVQNGKDNIAGLLQLSNAQKNFTVVETSLLTPEACDMAVQGCDFVIHTGTPSSCSVRDPLSELQEPGVHSIGSRMHCIIPMMTNFIQACARARVKRVVLTSSIAAMADSVTPHSIINDACWNVTSTLEKNPHFLSLKLAEEAAWQLVDQLPSDRRIDLVTINPGMLFGPMLLRSKLAPGNQVIFDLITGQYSALVDLNWSMVDVRDCAAAHIAALENNDARGRYICVNRSVWMKEIVEILSKNGYSGRDLPWKVGLPHWVGRLPAYSVQLGQVGASLYACDPTSIRSSPYLGDKLVEHLNIRFRPVHSTFVESANDLLKWGLIKPWAEDHEALECGCCHHAFTFYRRKHHCRECGVIICNDCSMSRAVVEGSLKARARLCDKCVTDSIPDLLKLLKQEDPDKKMKAVIALESLMENPLNHDYVTRFGGTLLLMDAIHHSDELISSHAAGALCALSCSVASTLQMVLEGVVLQMLEVEETLSTWEICLQALRNIWKQICRQDFRRMLYAVARVSADKNIGELRGNILLTFVHMMDPGEVTTLLPEGLLSVLSHMLQSTNEFSRCAAAHAIKHLVPTGYDPDVAISVPPYVVDDHEELFLNSSLSDLQFLVKGHIAPINAHKVVLFFRNSYFKNMVKFGSTTNQTAVIEVDNCRYEVFSILLRFLYTGKVDITADVAEELLRASSFYCVYELQKRTEAFLSGQICVENVVDLLTLSEECNADDLKKNCVPFLMRHIHEVVRLPAFEEHRVRSSEEVLKALTNMLGHEWETSYAKIKNLSGIKESDKAEDELGEQGKLDKENGSFNKHQVNKREDVPLSPRVLLSPVPNYNIPEKNAWAFATESSVLSTVVKDKSTETLHYLKTFTSEEMLFRRSRNYSDDFAEGLTEEEHRALETTNWILVVLRGLDPTGFSYMAAAICATDLQTNGIYRRDQRRKLDDTLGWGRR